MDVEAAEERWVVLLRGVNVGGRRRVAMADLRAALVAADYRDVVTHLQSGNVVLTADAAPEALAASVARLIAARFGHDVPVAVRSTRELRAVTDRDPLPGAADDPKRYVVTFLAAPPDDAALHRLAGLATAEERLHADGRELYTHHPQGQARSKLAAALTGAALGPSATARNWTTVSALARLAADTTGCG